MYAHIDFYLSPRKKKKSLPAARRDFTIFLLMVKILRHLSFPENILTRLDVAPSENSFNIINSLYCIDCKQFDELLELLNAFSRVAKAS